MNRTTHEPRDVSPRIVFALRLTTAPVRALRQR